VSNRSLRDDAATLAVFRQSIEDSKVEYGDHVIFKLGAWILVNALEAADGAGCLGRLPQMAP
jgi:hypothetical protein